MMKTPLQLLLLAVLTLMLGACAGVQQGSFDAHLARAAVQNDLPGVYRNVNPRNATMRIRDEQPIYWAAAHGNEDMIDVLYNNGASLKYRSSSGRSLAYVAASHGHRATGSKLVRLGAGTPGDLQAGAHDHAINQQAIKERNRQMQAVALAFAAALLRGGGGGGGGAGCEICGAPVDWSGRWCSQHGAAVHSQMQRNWPN